MESSESRLSARTPIPDYTSLCKCSKTLNVPLKAYDKRGPLNILVDSAYVQRKVYLATSKDHIRLAIPFLKNARLDCSEVGFNGNYCCDAILTARLAGLNAWKERVRLLKRRCSE